MKTKIAIIIVIVLLVCGIISAADPNEPVLLQIVRVRLLTAEESLALQVNGLTLSQLVNRLLEHELPQQIRRAKENLSNKLTLIEIQEAKK